MRGGRSAPGRASGAPQRLRVWYERGLARTGRSGSVASVTPPDQPPGAPTLVLERLPDGPHEPDFVADRPLVGFDAFLSDVHLYGWIRLGEDRLTDLLNEHEEIGLLNVQLERSSDGRPEWHEGFVLRRADLLAVRAGAPRGDPSRRRHSRLHALAVESGPYLIGGYLHVPPGVRPLDHLRERPPFVPLSMAWLEHWGEGRRRRQWDGTIIFNRERATAVDLVTEELLEFGVLTWPLVASACWRPADLGRSMSSD